MRKTLIKPKLGDQLQNICPIHLKTVKVMKNETQLRKHHSVEKT
jgi:hypothetical protein